MGKVIVITSGKGGVGKTTTTANLGHGLAALGRKVCLVDADIGLHRFEGSYSGQAAWGEPSAIGGSPNPGKGRGQSRPDA